MHPAPEAGALSGLSYGDAEPVYKLPDPRPNRERSLRIPLPTFTLLKVA